MPSKSSLFGLGHSAVGLLAARMSLSLSHGSNLQIFFPFRDSIDAAADAGILAIIEPGGSIRDKEVIAAADERGIPLIFTGVRSFRH